MLQSLEYLRIARKKSLLG